MANITNYQDPVTGKTENLFNISGIWQKILGVVVLLFAVTMAQKVGSAVGGRFKMFDTTPDPITGVPSGPSEVIY